MNRTTLVETIKGIQSFLCVGLDTDPAKLPAEFEKGPAGVLAFNRRIIDATRGHCIAYKINTAFYEAMGAEGWRVMEETVAYIPATHFKIADAKRGDIGNTSNMYARAFFETLAFDAITVAPYMGEDSIRPFLEYENKWTIVLGLTSNKGAADFELLPLGAPYTGKKLFENLMETVSKWGTPSNLMFVAGATQARELANIRTIVPEHFLLVPGIGAQGGSLDDVAEYGMNKDCGLLVNASRAVLYTGSEKGFEAGANEAAREYHSAMRSLLVKHAHFS